MFIDILFILKAVISISIVVGLSLVAERVGPRMAGLLTGLPLGAGMVVIFTGIEQGVGFTARSAVHMIPGFVTTLVFIYAYAAVSARQGIGGIHAVMLPSLLAIVGYALSAFAMSYIQLPLKVSVPLIMLCLVMASRMMAYLPNTPILVRVSFGWRVLAFRAGMATAAILLITGVAGSVGEQWTGLLTGFPLSLYPLILVLHITYSGNEVAAVLKNVPMSLGGLVSFCLTVTWSLPALGLVWGTAMATMASVGYLVCYSQFYRWRHSRKAK